MENQPKTKRIEELLALGEGVREIEDAMGVLKNPYGSEESEQEAQSQVRKYAADYAAKVDPDIEVTDRSNPELVQELANTCLGESRRKQGEFVRENIETLVSELPEKSLVALMTNEPVQANSEQEDRIKYQAVQRFVRALFPEINKRQHFRTLRAMFHLGITINEKAAVRVLADQCQNGLERCMSCARPVSL